MKDRKILIVEDEQIIAENLRFILNEKGYNFVDVAIDAIEAQNLFEEESYDLVLMDIDLGTYSQMDGIELIKLLLTKYDFLFLYVTANADQKTIEKAKTTNPNGYILKPFVNASIYANVEIVLNTLDKQKYFSFVNKETNKKIVISEITFIKAEGSYIEIYTLNEERKLIRASLIECEECYPTVFIRIHKSILINKYNIQRYTSKLVTVNKITLPLGRAYKAVFSEKIKNFPFS